MISFLNFLQLFVFLAVFQLLLVFQGSVAFRPSLGSWVCCPSPDVNQDAGFHGVLGGTEVAAKSWVLSLPPSCFAAFSGF